MLDKVIRTIKVFAFILAVSLITGACGLGSSLTPEPTQAVSVEDAVAQTVAAQNAVELQVAQTVAAAQAAQGSVPTTDAGAVAPSSDTGEPDIADPAEGLESSKPVADPNLASGTPQLRVNVSSANVRNGPGTNYRPISSLLKDSVVTVIAKNQNGSWFLIDFSNGQRGWISGSVAVPVVAADMVNVPVAATIPAPPAFTPTATATQTPVSTSTVAPTNTAVTTGTALPSATATAAATAATATATATPPAPVQTFTDITVVNNSIIEICFLFIDLSAEPWSIDRLGPTDTLMPGFQITFTFPTGEYDFMAQDCNGVVIANMFNVQVLSPFTWDIR